jgi:hypothetical protein
VTGGKSEEDVLYYSEDNGRQRYCWKGGISARYFSEIMELKLTLIKLESKIYIVTH